MNEGMKCGWKVGAYLSKQLSVCPRVWSGRVEMRCYLNKWLLFSQSNALPMNLFMHIITSFNAIAVGSFAATATG